MGTEQRQVSERVAQPASMAVASSSTGVLPGNVAVFREHGGLKLTFRDREWAWLVCGLVAFVCGCILVVNPGGGPPEWALWGAFILLGLVGIGFGLNTTSVIIEGVEVRVVQRFRIQRDQHRPIDSVRDVVVMSEQKKDNFGNVLVTQYQVELTGDDDTLPLLSKPFQTKAHALGVAALLRQHFGFEAESQNQKPARVGTAVDDSRPFADAAHQ